MIQHRYYDADVDPSRPRFCWQTWLAWMIGVAIYMGWSYAQAPAAVMGEFDWTGFGIDSLLAALVGLVIKAWVDLRIAQLR